MNMRPVAITVAAIVLVLQWPFIEHERADAKLEDFYSQMTAARFGDARESIGEAIRLWPSNARYYSWRAYCTSQQLPSQCPRHQQNLRASVEEEARQLAQDAAKDYRHSLELNIRDAVAHHNLAWLEHLLGDDAAAEMDWEEAVSLDPDNTVFHLSYGMFLEESGNRQAANGQYEMAIELSPSLLDSPFFVALKNRSPQTAESIVTDSVTRIDSRLRDGTDPILEARLGKLYLYARDLTRSAALLEDAAAQLPNLPLVWFNLAEVRAEQGNSAEAMLYYGRAMTIDASLPQPYLRVGENNLKSGDRNSALRNLNLAVQRWQHVKPITAAHNNRLYGGPRQTIDDLLPTTLVWYTTPCEVSRAWADLAQLFPEQSEYARRTRTCEELPSPHIFEGDQRGK